MRVDVEYRPYKYSIWLKRGNTCYAAKWYGLGRIRKRALLEAMMRQHIWYHAPWLWD